MVITGNIPVSIYIASCPHSYQALKKIEMLVYTCKSASAHSHGLITQLTLGNSRFLRIIFSYLIFAWFCFLNIGCAVSLDILKLASVCSCSCQSSVNIYICIA